MKKSTRIIAAISGLALIATFFAPIWMILLEAPQFPEGLKMLIWINKLTGNVDTINGLNHYIGMQKISAESFPELKILPVAMGFFVFFGVLTAIINKKGVLYTYTSLLVLFSIVSMIDFYMWEHSYGHDLDPKAPIKLDDMSFQPPLLGYKQIANFLAGSFPALGGGFFILSVLLAVIASVIELNIFKRKKPVSVMNIITFFAIFMMSACNKGDTNPVPINFGIDECNHCKMTISDKKYGAEILTAKGKAYIFDDLGCLADFEKEFVKTHANEKLQRFVINFYSPASFINLDNAHLLKGSSLRTPMASGWVAFGTADEAQKAQKEYGGEITTGKTFK